MRKFVLMRDDDDRSLPLPVLVNAFDTPEQAVEWVRRVGERGQRYYIAKLYGTFKTGDMLPVVEEELL